jgi:hypothetical protein
VVELGKVEGVGESQDVAGEMPVAPLRGGERAQAARGFSQAGLAAAGPGRVLDQQRGDEGRRHGVRDVARDRLREDIALVCTSARGQLASRESVQQQQ